MKEPPEEQEGNGGQKNGEETQKKRKGSTDSGGSYEVVPRESVISETWEEENTAFFIDAETGEQIEADIMKNTGEEIRMIRHDNYGEVRSYANGKPFTNETTLEKEHLTPVDELFSPSPAVTPQQEGDDLDLLDTVDELRGPQEPKETPLQQGNSPKTPNSGAYG